MAVHEQLPPIDRCLVRLSGRDVRVNSASQGYIGDTLDKHLPNLSYGRLLGHGLELGDSSLEVRSENGEAATIVVAQSLNIFESFDSIDNLVRFVGFDVSEDCIECYLTRGWLDINSEQFFTDLGGVVEESRDVSGSFVEFRLDGLIDLIDIFAVLSIFGLPFPVVLVAGRYNSVSSRGCSS